MIRAVFLDAGGTLVFDHGFRERLAEEIACCLSEHGLQPPPRERILDAWARPPWSGNFEYWDLMKAAAMLRRLGFMPRPELVEDVYRHVLHAYRRGFRMDPAVPRVLRELREMGLTVGVISNVGNYEIVSERFEALGIRHMVDLIVASQAAVWKKPSPEIYRLACFLAGVEPGEAVHVGDHPELDIAAAKRAGLRAVQVLKAAPERSKIADAWIDTVGALPEVIRSWIGIPASRGSP